MSTNNYNSIISYIIEEINPTVGETVYDPCMRNGELLGGVIDYISIKHDNNINWHQFTNMINGVDINTINVDNTLQLLKEKTSNYNLFSSYESDMVCDFISQGVDFQDTILCGDSINSTKIRKYNIIITNPYDININDYVELAMDSLNTNGRCAIIVNNDFLSNQLYCETRKRLVDSYNVDKIIMIDMNHSIIFFRNKNQKTLTVYYYSLVDKMEIFNIVKTDEYIRMNNYILNEYIDNYKLDSSCVDALSYIYNQFYNVYSSNFANTSRDNINKILLQSINNELVHASNTCKRKYINEDGISIKKNKMK